MITYSTCSGATPAFSSAPLMANPPSSAAEKPFSEPSSRPIGVRAPATITDPDMVCLSVVGFWSVCPTGHDAAAGAGPADMACLSRGFARYCLMGHDSHGPGAWCHRIGVTDRQPAAGSPSPRGHLRPRARIAHGVGSFPDGAGPGARQRGGAPWMHRPQRPGRPIRPQRRCSAPSSSGSTTWAWRWPTSTRRSPSTSESSACTGARGGQRGAGGARGHGGHRRVRVLPAAAGPPAPGLPHRQVPRAQRRGHAAAGLPGHRHRRRHPPGCARPGSACSTPSPSGAPPGRGSTSSTPRTAAGSWSSWWSRARRTDPRSGSRACRPHPWPRSACSAWPRGCRACSGISRVPTRGRIGSFRPSGGRSQLCGPRVRGDGYRPVA